MKLNIQIDIDDLMLLPDKAIDRIVPSISTCDFPDTRSPKTKVRDLYRKVAAFYIKRGLELRDIENIGWLTEEMGLQVLKMQCNSSWTALNDQKPYNPPKSHIQVMQYWLDTKARGPHSRVDEDDWDRMSNSFWWKYLK